MPLRNLPRIVRAVGAPPRKASEPMKTRGNRQSAIGKGKKIQNPRQSAISCREDDTLHPDSLEVRALRAARGAPPITLRSPAAICFGRLARDCSCCPAADADAQEAGRRGGGRGGRFRRRGPSTSAAWLHFSENGTVTAYTGKAEVGQNIRTSLTQAVARRLKDPVASVTLVMDRYRADPLRRRHLRQPHHALDGPDMHRAAAAAREALLDRAAEA